MNHLYYAAPEAAVQYGGFHQWGYPTSWVYSGKSESKSGWWLGVPLWLRKPLHKSSDSFNPPVSEHHIHCIGCRENRNWTPWWLHVFAIKYSGLYLPDSSNFLRVAARISKNCTMWGVPTFCLLIYNPLQLVCHKYHKNPTLLVVMFTSLAIKPGPHIVSLLEVQWRLGMNLIWMLWVKNKYMYYVCQSYFEVEVLADWDRNLYNPLTFQCAYSRDSWTPDTKFFATWGTWGVLKTQGPKIIHPRGCSIINHPAIKGYPHDELETPT